VAYTPGAGVALRFMSCLVINGDFNPVGGKKYNNNAWNDSSGGARSFTSNELANGYQLVVQ
jgi:hypothetical protein